jgi:hypothetical protein
LAEATPELQAAYQRGYGDCTVNFLKAIVEGAQVCSAEARKAHAAGDARRYETLCGGAEALIAFAKGFVGGARG